MWSITFYPRLAFQLASRTYQGFSGTKTHIYVRKERSVLQVTGKHWKSFPSIWFYFQVINSWASFFASFVSLTVGRDARMKWDLRYRFFCLENNCCYIAEDSPELSKYEYLSHRSHTSLRSRSRFSFWAKEENLVDASGEKRRGDACGETLVFYFRPQVNNVTALHQLTKNLLKEDHLKTWNRHQTQRKKYTWVCILVISA